MARSVDVLNSIISSDFVLAIVVALLIAYNVNRYLKCRVSPTLLFDMEMAEIVSGCKSFRQASWLPINHTPTK